MGEGWVDRRFWVRSLTLTAVDKSSPVDDLKRAVEMLKKGASALEKAQSALTMAQFHAESDREEQLYRSLGRIVRDLGNVVSDLESLIYHEVVWKVTEAQMRG